MAKENESVQGAVATAVTEAVSDMAPQTSNEDEKLDARAELFVRKLTDSVTKAIADLLKPPAQAKDDDDGDDDKEEDSPVHRRRRAPSPQPKKKNFFESLGL